MNVGTTVFVVATTEVDGPAVSVGAGKVDVLVGDAKGTAEAVGVTVFSGDEPQAAMNTVTKIRLSNLAGIFIVSISILF